MDDDEQGSNVSCAVASTESADDASQHGDKSHLNSMKPTLSSQGGTDSSDIEILQEEPDSSDSIEVLDSEKNADTQSVNTLSAGLEGSGEVSPATIQDDVHLLALSTVNDTQFKSVDASSQKLNNANASSDSNPIPPKAQDSNITNNLEPKPSAKTMDTNAYLMQRLLVDMSLHQTQTLPPHGQSVNNPFPSQGLCYENIYDSSDYPSGSNAQSEEELAANGGKNRPDSLSLPKPLQYYEKKRKVRREISESSMSTSSSVDALIEEVSKTPLSMQVTDYSRHIDDQNSLRSQTFTLMPNRV